MKFVKGFAVFLVLCLAAYGAFVLLKRPPQLNVTDDERHYLQGMGIHVQGNDASDSGLSAIFGDLEGVDPIGVSVGTSFSIAPPGFIDSPALDEPTTSYAPPPFLAAPAPRVAASFDEPQPTLEIPPPSIVDPAGLPGSPSFDETLPFESAPLEVPAAESPPPWDDGWDGPASDISATPPHANTLQSPNSPPSPIQHRTAEKVVHLPATEKNVRRIVADSEDKAPPSSANKVSFDPASQYVKTTARQPIAFETVKPESPPNTPTLSFAPVRQIQQEMQSEQSQQTAVSLQQPIVVSQPESRDEVLRLVKSSTALHAAPSAAPDTENPFIREQRSLVESNNPENIRRAFIALSQFYEHNRLDDSQRARVRSILDTLALKVIYARNSHILEPAYRVKPGETIESIAHNFKIHSVLLRKINGLSPFQELPAGATLKVIHGQFDAKISIQRKELTLLLGGLYAGQFSFSVPNPHVQTHSGEFFVMNRTDRMLVLNSGLILSTAQTRDVTFVFTDQDAREIFDILSEQSVIIME